jgi:anti-anti-sigma factor
LRFPRDHVRQQPAPGRRRDACAQAETIAVRVDREETAVIMQLFGELDLASCPVFERRFADALRTHAGHVIIDLSGLDFVDIAGVHALERAHERARERLLILRGSAAVHRIFVVTGCDAGLPFVD